GGADRPPARLKVRATPGPSRRQFQRQSSQVMNVAAFDFDLPAHLIAQTPPAERGTSHLLVLDKADGRIEHAGVAALPEFLRDGDLLVVNDTKVFPARLLGNRTPSGGAVECFLLSKREEDQWDALV